MFVKPSLILFLKSYTGYDFLVVERELVYMMSTRLVATLGHSCHLDSLRGNFL